MSEIRGVEKLRKSLHGGADSLGNLVVEAFHYLDDRSEPPPPSAPVLPPNLDLASAVTILPQSLLSSLAPSAASTMHVAGT